MREVARSAGGREKASNTSIFSPPVTYGDSPLVRGGQGIVPQFNSSINWDLAKSSGAEDFLSSRFLFFLTGAVLQGRFSGLFFEKAGKIPGVHAHGLRDPGNAGVCFTKQNAGFSNA